MANPEATVTLTSSDDVDTKVERVVAERSVLIKDMLNYIGDTDEAIPIPNVNKRVLDKVITWCRHHHEHDRTTQEKRDSPEDTDVDNWDREFMRVDQELLFGIILAANYLNIEQLLDIGCKTVANTIKGKTAQEIRKIFNIQNDFTPGEEDQIRRENAWVKE
ncbi:hypothetical protein N7476_005133 [Penicillium atrosanguineum]|uniref:E3 ubiquitin ligase complex SCF subunit n=1 Tax=Penicillium atrosanguineum TaxID=1132637 RepID=A0A9W9PYS1_9EURO|nr:hypothetical protein N7476_005133 [Penicillium atrosanguineum]